MLGIITREIHLTEHFRIEPIRVTYGSNIPIRFEFVDYAFATGSYQLEAYAKCSGYESTTKNPDGNWENYLIADGITQKYPAVHVWPQAGFFRPGNNEIQITLYNANVKLITFHFPVVCESDESTGEHVDATEITPLVVRAEQAAETALTSVTDYIKIQDTQPTELGNKIWINTGADISEIEILTRTGTEKVIDEKLEEAGISSYPVTSVNGKKGSVALTSDDITYPDSDDHPDGTVGGEIASVKTTIGDVSDLEFDADDIVDALNKAYQNGGGSEEWEDVTTVTLSEDADTTGYTEIAFQNGYKKIFVIIDESGISGTAYSSLRTGVLGLNNIKFLANTSDAYKTNNKWKTFYAEMLTKQIYRYAATSEIQLSGYVTSPQFGQYIESNRDIEFFNGICIMNGTSNLKAGTAIKVCGVKA